MNIGVLALQGAFVEHERKLRGLGAACLQIRQLRDLEQRPQGLVLPGGESTVQGRLLRELGLLEPIRQLIEEGVPVLGTCAGLILMARTIDGGEEAHLGTLPVCVRRNAYGRQLGSFQTTADFGGQPQVPMTFIRGPYISGADPDVTVLARVGGKVAAVQYGAQIGVAFHPELTESTVVHSRFLDLVRRGTERAAS